MDGSNKLKYSIWREVCIRSNKWETAQQGYQEKWDKKEDEANNKKEKFPSFLGTSKINSAIECNKTGNNL